MQPLKNHWEKLILVVSLVVLGLFGWNLFGTLTGEHGADRLQQQEERIQEEQDNTTARSALPAADFSEQYAQEWESDLPDEPGSKYLFYWPPLVQPTTQEVGPTTTHRLSNLVNVQANAEMGQISLSWDFETPSGLGNNEVAYQPDRITILRQSGTREEWTEISSFDQNIQSYVDENVEARTRYRYKIRYGINTNANVFNDPQHEPGSPSERETDPVEIRAESRVSISFTGNPTGNQVAIRIRKWFDEAEQWMETTVFAEPGGNQNIGEGEIVRTGGRVYEFDTPFTLLEMGTVEEPICVERQVQELGEQGQEITVYEYRRQVWERKRIRYEDQEGNEFEAYLEGDSPRVSGEIVDSPPHLRYENNETTEFRYYPGVDQPPCGVSPNSEYLQEQEGENGADSGDDSPQEGSGSGNARGNTGENDGEESTE